MQIIIGAGITGLSYALFTKSSDYLILEKEPEVGGYCRTTNRNGFIWDYSGHFFHFQNSDIRDLVLSGMDCSALRTVEKCTKIKYKDLLVDYPFQKNIHQLAKEELIECLYDLFFTEKRSYSNFKDMLYCKFGKSIADKFLIPYNEKLYACNLNNLDKDAMGRFFPFAEKEEIIKNFKSEYNSSYNGTFLYPAGGAIEYVNSIFKKLDKNKVRINTEVKQIFPDKHKVLLSNGDELKYDRLISTIPFPELLEKANIPYDKSAYTWNQVLVFNLGFDSKGIDRSNHWVYFPEKKYCFYRVGFYDNILGMNDRMSLYVELGFSNNVQVQPAEWLGKVLKDLHNAGIVSDNQTLIDYQTILMNPAYVHINQTAIMDTAVKKEYLSKHNIYSIGRYGSWTYCSIEDNIKEAKELAIKLK